MGSVHHAADRGADAATCGASLLVVGASFRTIADDGVTCPACRALLALPPL